MPKYGEAAQKNVERALHKRKKGRAEIRGIKENCEEPQAGHRHWTLGDTQEGRQGAAQARRA